MSEGSSQFGRGTVRVDVQNGAYVLVVTVAGLTPNTRHLINFHRGTCANPDVSQWVQIEVATANSTGALTSRTTWPGDYFIAGTGRIVTVHGDQAHRNETHIACANLAN